MEVAVRRLSGEESRVAVGVTAAVKELRSTISAASGVAASELRLVFAQRLLADEELVGIAGLDADTGAVVTVVREGGAEMPPIRESAAVPADADAAIAAEAVESAAFAAPLHPAPVPSEGGAVRLRVRTPRGQVREMSLAAGAPVTELASRAAAIPELEMGSQRVSVLFCGSAVGPEATASSLGLRDGDGVQLGQRSVSLTGRPEAADLAFSCQFCRAASAPMQLRPLCSVCGSEAVRVTAGSCSVGSIRWEQLLDARLACFECGAQNSPAGFGFLCDRRDPDTGAQCPSRVVAKSDASLAHRGFSHVFSGSSREALAALLRGAFSGE